jgi:hypothetical protein
MGGSILYGPPPVAKPIHALLETRFVAGSSWPTTTLLQSTRVPFPKYPRTCCWITLQPLRGTCCPLHMLPVALHAGHSQGATQGATQDAVLGVRCTRNAKGVSSRERLVVLVTCGVRARETFSEQGARALASVLFALLAFFWAAAVWNCAQPHGVSGGALG